MQTLYTEILFILPSRATCTSAVSFCLNNSVQLIYTLWLLLNQQASMLHKQTTSMNHINKKKVLILATLTKMDTIYEGVQYGHKNEQYAHDMQSLQTKQLHP